MIPAAGEDQRDRGIFELGEEHAAGDAFDDAAVADLDIYVLDRAERHRPGHRDAGEDL